MKASEEKSMSEEETFQPRFFWLSILGFIVIFAGIAVLVVTTLTYGTGQSSFGGVIFIGPIPIVIGAGPNATWLILFALIIAALSILMLLFMRRRSIEHLH